MSIYPILGITRILLNKELRIFVVYPFGNYLLKVNNRNTRRTRNICSKLTIKTSERPHWRRSGVFIVNFEHISQEERP